MDTKTLIKVVARINLMKVNVIRLTEDGLCQKSFEEGWNVALDLLSNHLQKGIDADVASMESARENGE